jgi:hypothetical protein
MGCQSGLHATHRQLAVQELLDGPLGELEVAVGALGVVDLGGVIECEVVVVNINGIAGCHGSAAREGTRGQRQEALATRGGEGGAVGERLLPKM